MAKKKQKNVGELPDPMAAFMAIDENAQILSESDCEPEEWISTGSYALDAAIGGSIIKGGIPSNKMVLFAGPSQTGKSYLAVNICREAINKGYHVLYLDSEGGITPKFVSNLGADPKKVLIRLVNSVHETTHIILQLIEQCEQEEKNYGTHNKWMVVIDSVGNLTSNKEKEDLLKIDPATGTVPRDMSRAQNVKSLFRCITSPLSKLQIPLICVTHTYQSMSMYQADSLAGGSGLEYCASVIVELSKSKLDDKLTNKKAEESVNSGDITRTGVLVTCKIRKSRFTIPRKIRMMISYYVPMRKEFYLESYLNWDNSGVGRGTIITEKEYQKLSPADKNRVKTYEYEGQTCYALLKDTARSIVVSRKNIAVPVTEFLSPKVFDKEFLEYIDEKIIKPVFELPSAERLRLMDDVVEALEIKDEDDD